MSKPITFLLGVFLGASVLLAVAIYIGFDFSVDSATHRMLSDRLEAVPVEEVCKSLVAGKPISVEDHAAAWTDGKRYVVAGWHVEGSGAPVFSWVGADLSDDVPACNSVRNAPRDHAQASNL